MLKHISFRFVFLGCLVLFLSSCGLNDTLKVGVEKGFRPFAYVEDGQEKGFDIDLWEAIANEAGFKYEFKPMGQGEMLKAVEKGEIDVAMAGITMQDDRKKLLDFATPYYDTGLVMLTLSENNKINKVKDLEKKVVATKIGSSGYDYVSKVKGIKQIRAFPEIDQAYQELVNKRVDVVIFDKASVEQFINSQGRGQVKTVGKILTNEQYGIAMEKGSKYAGRINNALRRLSEKGAYELIYIKWFGEYPKSLPGNLQRTV